ncbi:MULTISPECIES: 1-deoxy-D-xylulose-5-phosphate reductoisomerase [unclassified Enterococcus]|uniref:1-deoxy-D-xylulose-5-phosphate reductoisomerase n=1 Tax=unclassified Enterococcus TaxID=2608891 RepID=UPI001551A4B5|nr:MULTISPECIES: 1-deoxy-D-xylulose-5-phosphate reductoisomerase [unclassified Enterococcus]MBS7577606.1 1-deoxy-D-xylulose-5-phosphate reductoisomerase [Enterococcus sp. MMGLQ5-2]MBS7584895.1 1-deoxy-D-xylulose-5-phosphate reductoisomerase [Enterococcus sp. MMGLQ5-1]NPD12750.1 1-deoxy-D-xylulose-5-phosphate reductoisomerase [Enterococcus sp. MMGLQ5-1]NPD37439.1 1-deoxy-D-xylulose-5-phosphate reductoisomerase [Enterococcus sp. MMGLQ5-2]
MKKICLLGATGSVGGNTLDVIQSHPESFSLAGFSFNQNIERACEIIRDFKPKFVAAGNVQLAQELQSEFSELTVFSGLEGLVELASTDYDLILTAVMGSVGLRATIRAIELKRQIAIANKETLVMAGDFITALAKKNNVDLLTVDSEHSAIFQCLQGVRREDITSITITASGGSFRDRTRAELEGVTVADALNHPNWSMGQKITIDSATMVNKGLEVIEAHFLFDLPYNQIKTILHRESVVHSLITMKDGASFAELGANDMRQPIQYALTYPEHLKMNHKKPFDLAEIGQLHFEAMDYERFPMLALAYWVGNKGGSYPTVYNAANEIAVAAFLQDKITFLEIEQLISEAVAEHQEVEHLDLDKIIKIDEETRLRVSRKIR